MQHCVLLHTSAPLQQCRQEGMQCMQHSNAFARERLRKKMTLPKSAQKGAHSLRCLGDVALDFVQVPEFHAQRVSARGRQAGAWKVNVVDSGRKRKVRVREFQAQRISARGRQAGHLKDDSRKVDGSGLSNGNTLHFLVQRHATSSHAMRVLFKSCHARHAPRCCAPC